MITIYENSDTQELPEVKTIPTVIKAKVKSKRQISSYTQTFLSNYDKKLSANKNTLEAKIKVSDVLARVARLYEKIRTTVEYKAENVLRRNAIERILKRLIWEQETITEGVNSQKVAKTLIKELIWARYLPNNFLPESKIIEVEAVISKYTYLLTNLDNVPDKVTPFQIKSWIWGIASSELEDLLDPSNRDLFIALMYDWFTAYFDWKDEGLSKHEKEIQIYLAIHRAYTKSDDQIIRYHLLLREFPGWEKADRVEVNRFILKLPEIYSKIEAHLNFKGRLSLFRRVQRQVAAFEIFQAIAKEEKLGLKNLIKNKTEFEKRIISVCDEKYRQIRSKVTTGIIRSIIYIFVTKVVLALLIEVPYEILKFQDIRYLPLTINIMFPPLMMWLVGLSIKVPGAKNTEAILERLDSVVYEEAKEARNTFSITSTNNNSKLVQIFSLIYGLLFIVVFGGITYLLLKINFTFVGIIIFFGFLSLVMLFAFRIRFNANELKVNSEEEGFLDHLFSYLSLPFLNMGVYLSRGLAKLNFLTIILDFLIEAPLKSVIEIFEEWTSFLRQKKEEVVEVPE